MERKNCVPYYCCFVFGAHFSCFMVCMILHLDISFCAHNLLHKIFRLGRCSLRNRALQGCIKHVLDRVVR